MGYDTSPGSQMPGRGCQAAKGCHRPGPLLQFSKLKACYMEGNIVVSTMIKTKALIGSRHWAKEMPLGAP